MRFLDNNSSEVERQTHFTLSLNAPLSNAALCFHAHCVPTHTHAKHPVGLCANRLRSHARRITAGDAPNTRTLPVSSQLIQASAERKLRTAYCYLEIFFLVALLDRQLQSLLRPKTVLGPELVHRDHDCRKKPLKTHPNNKPVQLGRAQCQQTPDNTVPFRSGRCAELD